jgi:cell wall-associated NlpC family hydrolase
MRIAAELGLILAVLFCASPGSAQPAGTQAAVVVRSVENMHSRPDPASDVVSQALLGDNVRILEPMKNSAGEEWFRIETPDTYKGWIAASALRLFKEGERAYASRGKIFAVTALVAYVYAEPDVTTRKPVSAAPASAILEVCRERDERWLKITLPSGDGAWIQKGDGELHDAPWTWPRTTPDEMVALSKRFLGLPYLWGGMTPWGLDCSGFVQLIYKMSGIPILRDADIQYEGSGLKPFDANDEKVDGVAILRPGDLVFFGPAKDKITHVGMMLNSEDFINATTWQRPVVQISHLSEAHWREIYQGARRAEAERKPSGPRRP